MTVRIKAPSTVGLSLTKNSPSIFPSLNAKVQQKLINFITKTEIKCVAYLLKE